MALTRITAQSMARARAREREQAKAARRVRRQEVEDRQRAYVVEATKAAEDNGYNDGFSAAVRAGYANRIQAFIRQVNVTRGLRGQVFLLDRDDAEIIAEALEKGQNTPSAAVPMGRWTGGGKGHADKAG